jgi:hypothetical protein
MDSVKRFSTLGFFRESVSPKPQIVSLGLFRISPRILLIRGDIRSSKCKVANGKNLQSDPGLKEDDSWKKTWSKNSLDTVPLKETLYLLDGTGCFSWGEHWAGNCVPYRKFWIEWLVWYLRPLPTSLHHLLYFRAYLLRGCEAKNAAVNILKYFS